VVEEGHGSPTAARDRGVGQMPSVAW
jgi:hypothetical protein